MFDGPLASQSFALRTHVFNSFLRRIRDQTATVEVRTPVRKPPSCLNVRFTIHRQTVRLAYDVSHHLHMMNIADASLLRLYVLVHLAALLWLLGHRNSTNCEENGEYALHRSNENELSRRWRQ